MVVDGFYGEAGSYELVIMTPNATEVCNDGIDDDFDGDIDCLDANCLGDPSCVEDCGNGVDDDQDALADCLDPDCELDAACEEICDDGVDNDGDGRFDCGDPYCAADALCLEDCADGLDDNGNGPVDCQDFVCDGDPACDSVCPEGTLTGVPFTYTGTTLGRNDDQQGSCGSTGGPDYTLSFTAPAAGDYTFDTYGTVHDTTLYALAGCGGFEIDCNDDAPFGSVQSEPHPDPWGRRRGDHRGGRLQRQPVRRLFAEREPVKRPRG